MVKIRRALVSVWDKTGVEEFARFLSGNGVEIVSTGGTYKLLKDKGLPVKEVSKVTGFPEIMGGRVKTLHPAIHGGLLADKQNKEHMDQIAALGIEPFDMVVVNLYPFSDMLKKNLSFEEMIEYIDIGGPTMLRSAAKNMNSVAVVSCPQMYKSVMKEMKASDGAVGPQMRKALAHAVFEQTASYDAQIAAYLAGEKRIGLTLEEKMPLRYGENPHQKAGLYIDAAEGASTFKQLGGKELSFNNMLDINSSVRIACDFKTPACAVVKHTNPCGVALAANARDAYRKAYKSDPVSSFGGIIAFNLPVDANAAKEIVKSGFREVVAAPSFSKDAVAILSEKKNLRIIQVAMKKSTGQDIKKTAFGYLLQDEDVIEIDADALKVVTKKKPTAKQIEDMLFAWKIVKHVRSNAMVVVKNKITLGMGGGFTNRVDSFSYACDKSLASTKGAVLASDAFLPMEDNVDVAKKYGVSAIIQPGGSVRDQQVIEACDKAGIAMVFTGVRHFRH
jgi:phosphoribosylaminoimidazolecarboxamide formyltransferase/IMP cyclohydrolase